VKYVNSSSYKYSILKCANPFPPPVELRYFGGMAYYKDNVVLCGGGSEPWNYAFEVTFGTF
jgi:hypothetical protein